MSSFREIQKRMNDYSERNIPFLFLIDFDLNEAYVLKLTDINPDEILYSINGKGNAERKISEESIKILRTSPPPFDQYREKFENIQKQILYGNTYLLNLCHRSEVELSGDLKTIFHNSNAPYKLFFKDRFVLFSPESFIRIEGERISTFPMKGTMVKKDEKSRQELLDDVKESAEHATITDLLRNDLARVAKNVEVKRYRYIDEIRTSDKVILQVSSEISGKILPGLRHKHGDILAGLLPAGSVTGAPKQKTIDIIRNAENFKRGFYTGVFGISDGDRLESAVMIRYIEKDNDRYYYKSGGGITFMSDCEKEYQELIDKIYVPVY